MWRYQAGGYLLDKMLPFRSACVFSRYYWYYAWDICGRVIYWQYHASCILEVPSFNTNAKYGLNPHAVVTKHFLYFIQSIMQNWIDTTKVAIKLPVEITKFMRLIQLLLQFPRKKKLSFTDAHAHGTFAKKKKKLPCSGKKYWQKREQMWLIPYFSETSNLYKSKSRL